MPLPKTIKGFILFAATAVSVVMFGTLYTATTGVYVHAVQENAIKISETLANGTFNAMYQIMRQGWTRPQVEEFIKAVQTSSDQPYTIDIYRGDLVTRKFGPIEQKAMDELVQKTFQLSAPATDVTHSYVRYTYPLVARNECLVCHTNAQAGNVLGVIDVHQDIGSFIDHGRNDLMMMLLIIVPIPLLAAIGAAVFFQRKLDGSISYLQQNIDNINSVHDLTAIERRNVDLGFAEFNAIFEKVGQLSDKLRTVAVDKDLLEFEIRLLEKFVITSEVVRDWREYIGYLLVDINQVIEAYSLFSIFKVDDELFDLEVFWLRPPTERSKRLMEAAVRKALTGNPNFSNLPALDFHHHIAEPHGEPFEIEREQLELQTKSLIVETPKIGGIVGIGVHSDIIKDPTRLLVMESILSTLLNVVGSVKAIYKYTKDLEYYATRDPLTNLYNQRLFWELLGYEIKRAERHNYQFALLVVDLDNFKAINDSYGHAYGDKFLQEFAEAVHRALRLGDVFARYGGDEFVLILPEAGASQASALAERVLENASRLSLVAPDGARVKATVSIGVGIFPDHATDAKDLFLFADNMMYKAKSEGKNRVGVPTEDDGVEIFRNLGEKSMVIANAIEERKIIPYFQPIVAAHNGKLLAVEVLSRIDLGDTQVLGAYEFIELTEKLGLIHKLDYIVMDLALAEVQRSGYQGLVFLNLSPRALVLNEFLREVRAITLRHGLEPGRIVFEITERDTVKNIALLEKFVNELKSEGFGLAIDDFGSGFSSFHYLKRFPIDYVKIEGDFVVNMANDQRDAAFVKSMAALTQELGIKAIAEFVETEEVLNYVRRAGIDYVQGFYLGQPAPNLAAVMAQLEARKHTA